MADESKDQEKPAEAKPAKKPEKTEAPAQATADSSSGRKKINRLTLDEVEKELKVVKEKMGGFGSHYADHLLLRKKELTA